MLYSHPNRARVMDMTFSALNGIGATLLRVKITSALESSLGNWRYDNDVPQAWIMREAQARGPVKVLATAWGPPAWMKIYYQTTFTAAANAAFIEVAGPWRAPGPAGRSSTTCGSAIATCCATAGSRSAPPPAAPGTFPAGTSAAEEPW
jgi:hypothetical protein